MLYFLFAVIQLVVLAIVGFVYWLVTNESPERFMLAILFIWSVTYSVDYHELKIRSK